MPSTASRHPATRVVGALLCLAVAVIHVKDQGGVPGSKDPAYVHDLYLALEIGAVIAALALLARLVRPGWLLAAAVAAGPIAGYVLSRGPGLPNYTDDRGKWTEPLGLASLAVEAVLLILALAMLSARRRPAPSPVARRRPQVVRGGERARVPVSDRS
jgi:hypothetical protein